jgi:hypothetical protein
MCEYANYIQVGNYSKSVNQTFTDFPKIEVIDWGPTISELTVSVTYLMLAALCIWTDTHFCMQGGEESKNCSKYADRQWWTKGEAFVGGFTPHPEIPKFRQSWAEFPVPFKIHL